MNDRIKALLDLLDDDNQQAATFAMAELLTYDAELDSLLQELQESENKSVRRRIHQLQTILSIRRRRKMLAVKLKNDRTDLFNGLIDLHLQWYDNDNENMILDSWQGLVEDSRKARPTNLGKIGHFFKNRGFTAAGRGELEADYFCIGMVLEDQIGSDFILCTLAQKLAAQWGLELKILQVMGDFTLIDPKGQVMFPKRNWRLLPQLKRNNYRVWNGPMLLKLTTSMLFLCAVGTDSFRYIHTIGNCLAKLSGTDDLSMLPYPYNEDPFEQDENASE